MTTDRKVFTVETPKNPQNDRLYVPTIVKKKQVAAERLLRTRTTFSQYVMVSVGISKFGLTDLIFSDQVKINGGYYRDVFLSQHLLPVMRNVSGEFFIFQQDNAPAHRARDAVRLLEQATPAFKLSYHRICGHRTALTSIRLIKRYGAIGAKLTHKLLKSNLANW